MDFSQDDDALTTPVTMAAVPLAQPVVSQPQVFAQAQDNLATLVSAKEGTQGNNDLYENSPFMHVRGFPYACNKDDILAFLGVAETDLESYNTVLGTNGKTSGEVFLVIQNPDIREQCVSNHKKLYSETGRYIDVFKTSESYFQKRMNITLQYAKTFDGTVRVRGLPLKDGTEGILRELFDGLKIRKIMCPTQMNSERSCGEAFIQFKSFTDALAALEKNSHTLDGGYELEVNESCNNEFRGSLVAQAKMKHHHKWSSPEIKVGEYKAPDTNELNEYQRIISGIQASPAPVAETATEVQSEPVSAQQDGTTNVVTEGEPEAKKAKKSDNPYPHIVTVTEVNTEGLTSSMIQKYFKPHRAIAVNVRAADKAADVAFKSHEAAVAAMEKQGEELNEATCTLTLSSTAE